MLVQGGNVAFERVLRSPLNKASMSQIVMLMVGGQLSQKLSQKYKYSRAWQ